MVFQKKSGFLSETTASGLGPLGGKGPTGTASGDNIDNALRLIMH